MKHIKEQIVPLFLTVITFFALSFLFFIVIHVLNLFPIREKIHPELRVQDIVIGLTIYLKTSIDFAIFIGLLMHTHPGWKSRISIELGTAVGNALGTVLVLIIWNFFREVPLLMVLMIFTASCVLFAMAEESLSEFLEQYSGTSRFQAPMSYVNTYLGAFNRVFRPFLKLFIPHLSVANQKHRGFFSLFIFALTIPFVLGLDDFAGYIPLFSVVNVFGFSVGIFLGHMILNLGLFMSPKTTTLVVKNPFIMLSGGVIFIGIGIWGTIEALHILLMMLFHV